MTLCPLFAPAKRFAAIVLSALLMGETVPAQPSMPPTFNFALPATHGFITDSFAPMGKQGSAPEVIVIQDLHANRSVQFAISRILGQLKTKKWLPDTIAVEGAAGPVEVASMQTAASKPVRQRASDYLVNQGEMPGDMHFVVTEGKGQLFGIENADSYDSAVALYQQSYRERQGLAHHLERLSRAVALLSHDKNPVTRANAQQLSQDVTAIQTLVNQQVAGDELLPALHKAMLAVDHLQMVLPADGGRELLAPVSAAFNFYVLALERDDDMLANFLSLKEREQQPVGVMIVGGFHTPGVTDALKKKGMSYMVITPNVARHTSTDEKLYVARMLGDHLTPDQVEEGRDWAAMLVRQRLSPILQSRLFPRALKIGGLSIGALVLYLTSMMPLSGQTRPNVLPPPTDVKSRTLEGAQSRSASVQDLMTRLRALRLSDGEGFRVVDEKFPDNGLDQIRSQLGALQGPALQTFLNEALPGTFDPNSTPEERGYFLFLVSALTQANPFAMHMIETMSQHEAGYDKMSDAGKGALKIVNLADAQADRISKAKQTLEEGRLSDGALSWVETVYFFGPYFDPTTESLAIDLIEKHIAKNEDIHARTALVALGIRMRAATVNPRSIERLDRLLGDANWRRMLAINLSDKLTKLAEQMEQSMLYYKAGDEHAIEGFENRLRTQMKRLSIIDEKVYEDFLHSPVYENLDAARKTLARKGVVMPPFSWNWAYMIGIALAAGVMGYGIGRLRGRNTGGQSGSALSGLVLAATLLYAPETFAQPGTVAPQSARPKKAESAVDALVAAIQAQRQAYADYSYYEGQQYGDHSSAARIRRWARVTRADEILFGMASQPKYKEAARRLLKDKAYADKQKFLQSIIDYKPKSPEKTVQPTAKGSATKARTDSPMELAKQLRWQIAELDRVTYEERSANSQRSFGQAPPYAAEQAAIASTIRGLTQSAEGQRELKKILSKESAGISKSVLQFLQSLVNKPTSTRRARGQGGFSGIAVILLAFVSSVAAAIWAGTSSVTGVSSAVGLLAKSILREQRADLLSFFTPHLLLALGGAAIVALGIKRYQARQADRRQAKTDAKAIEPQVAKEGILDPTPRENPAVVESSFQWLPPFMHPRVKRDSQALMRKVIRAMA